MLGFIVVSYEKSCLLLSHNVQSSCVCGSLARKMDLSFKFSFLSHRFTVSLKYPFSVFGFKKGRFSVFCGPAAPNMCFNVFLISVKSSWSILVSSIHIYLKTKKLTSTLVSYKEVARRERMHTSPCIISRTSEKIITFLGEKKLKVL